MCAGLAAGGMKPFFAVYASFFQRSFDQMIHDVAMQQLPVTILLDRAGLVGEDGETHQGVFDFASVIPVPGMNMLAPRDAEELRCMLRWAAETDQPAVIRYGKALAQTDHYPHEPFIPGRWSRLTQGKDMTLLAVGSMVTIALEAAELLEKQGVSAGVVSCPSVKPLDESLLQSLDTPFATLEEHVLQGGFGSSVTTWRAEHGMDAPLRMLGVPDRFITHGSRAQLLQQLGLDAASAAETLQNDLRRHRHE